MTDQVEVNEAVVHRCDQRIGNGNRGTRQRIITSRRVDNHVISAVAKSCHFLIEASRGQQREHCVVCRRQTQATAPHCCGAVVEITRQRFLPRVEIQRGDPVPGSRERNGDMHRCRRFTRAALFISENNTMRARSIHHNKPWAPELLDLARTHLPKAAPVPLRAAIVKAE